MDYGRGDESEIELLPIRVTKHQRDNFCAIVTTGTLPGFQLSDASHEWNQPVLERSDE